MKLHVVNFCAYRYRRNCMIMNQQSPTAVSLSSKPVALYVMMEYFPETPFLFGKSNEEAGENPKM